MLRSSLRLLIGAQGRGYWQATDRQRRSLGSGPMKRASQEAFQQRHQQFKVQQQANLAQRDLSKAVRRQHRVLSSAASAAMYAEGRGNKKTAQLAAAREMLQLSEHVRKEEHRSRRFAFHELRARHEEYRRR